MEIQTPAVQRLPEELWVQLAIFLRDEFPCKHGKFREPGSLGCHFCRSTGNVVSLVSTCRFLRQIVQPLLFHRINIDFNDLRRIMAVTDSLEKVLGLYDNVHHLTITGSMLENTFIGEAIRPKISHFLQQLLHIRSLSIISSKISPEMVQLLLRSVYLRSVELSSSQWSTAATEAWVAGAPFCPPMFHFLRIHSPDDSTQANVESYAKLLSPTLKEVALFGRIWDVLPSEFPTTSFDHVIKFTYGFVSLRTTQAFLERMPNVEDVSYRGVAQRPPVPLSTLSRLRSVAGPPDFITAISRGRPSVVEQRVQCTLNPVDIRRMAILNSQLEKLCIVRATWSPETFRSIGQQCPQLTWLEIRGYDDGWKNADLAAAIAIANLPRLRVMLLTWMKVRALDPPTDAEKERRNLEKIKRRYCPHLHEAQISPKRTWAFLEGWVPVLR